MTTQPLFTLEDCVLPPSFKIRLLNSISNGIYPRMCLQGNTNVARYLIIGLAHQIKGDIFRVALQKEPKRKNKVKGDFTLRELEGLIGSGTVFGQKRILVIHDLHNFPKNRLADLEQSLRLMTTSAVFLPHLPKEMKYLPNIDLRFSSMNETAKADIYEQCVKLVTKFNLEKSEREIEIEVEAGFPDWTSWFQTPLEIPYTKLELPKPKIKKTRRITGDSQPQYTFDDIAHMPDVSGIFDAYMTGGKLEVIED